MIIQISTLVIKYWLRINSRIYEDQFVGKAASLCNQSSLPIAKFNALLLKLCNFSHFKTLKITSVGGSVGDRGSIPRQRNHYIFSNE